MGFVLVWMGSVRAAAVLFDVEEDVVSKATYRSLFEAGLGPQSHDLQEKVFVLCSQGLDFAFLVAELLLHVVCLLYEAPLAGPISSSRGFLGTDHGTATVASVLVGECRDVGIGFGMGWLVGCLAQLRG